MSQKSGIFNFTKLCQKTVGFLVVAALTLASQMAQGEDLCNTCMEYVSCMLDFSFSGAVSEIYEAQDRCFWAYADFLNSFPDVEFALAERGWGLGRALNNNIDAKYIEFTIAEIIYEQCLGYLTGVNFCESDSAPGMETYYMDYIIEFDKVGKSFFATRLIKQCPDGGEGMLMSGDYTAYTDGNGIASCHTSTFTDSTGSGEFVNENGQKAYCFYTP